MPLDMCILWASPVGHANSIILFPAILDVLQMQLHNSDKLSRVKNVSWTLHLQVYVVCLSSGMSMIRSEPDAQQTGAHLCKLWTCILSTRTVAAGRCRPGHVSWSYAQHKACDRNCRAS